MWKKVRGVFLMPSNGKNATNFFSPNMYLKMGRYRVSADIIIESSCKSQIYMLLYKRSKHVSLCKQRELYFIYIYIYIISLYILYHSLFPCPLISSIYQSRCHPL